MDAAFFINSLQEEANLVFKLIKKFTFCIMEKLNIKKFNQTVLNSKFALSKKHMYLCVKAKNPILIQLSFT